jgi:hypothetical protein
MNHRVAILLRRHAALKHPGSTKRRGRHHRRAWNATPWNKRHELKQVLLTEIKELS